MNLEFVRILQSMAEVEKDPRFRSKKYVIVDEEERQVDPASGEIPVVLKHRDIVESTTSSSLRLRREKRHRQPSGKRVDQLSTALFMARISSLRGSRGCSIVVHEGMYIDLTPFEIIGTEEVRIVTTSSIDGLFHVFQGSSLTLNDLTIYGLVHTAKR